MSTNAFGHDTNTLNQTIATWCLATFGDKKFTSNDMIKHGFWNVPINEGRMTTHKLMVGLGRRTNQAESNILGSHLRLRMFVQKYLIGSVEYTFTRTGRKPANKTEWVIVESDVLEEYEEYYS